MNRNRDAAITYICNLEYGLECIIRKGAKSEYDRKIYSEASAIIMKRIPEYYQKTHNKISSKPKEEYVNIMARFCLSYISSNRDKLIAEHSDI